MDEKYKDDESDEEDKETSMADDFDESDAMAVEGSTPPLLDDPYTRFKQLIAPQPSAPPPSSTTPSAPPQQLDNFQAMANASLDQPGAEVKEEEEKKEQAKPQAQRRIAFSPYGRVLYFIFTLVQALGMSVKDCFESYRFQAFLEASTRARNIGKEPYYQDFARDHCELLVARTTKLINWCIEKALVSVQECTLAGPLGRRLRLYDIIADAEFLTHFIALCKLVNHDIKVQSGQKYMARNAMTLEQQTKCGELSFFLHNSRAPRQDTPGELDFEVSPTESTRLKALEKLAAAVEGKDGAEMSWQDIPKELQNPFVKFATPPKIKQEPVGFSPQFARRSHGFILYLLGLVPEAELDAGLPKLAYFARLLMQAASKTKDASHAVPAELTSKPQRQRPERQPPWYANASQAQSMLAQRPVGSDPIGYDPHSLARRMGSDPNSVSRRDASVAVSTPLPSTQDLDFDITDVFPEYHIAALVERTGKLAHPLNRICVTLKAICHVTLEGKSSNEIVAWLTRDRRRMVQGIQLVVYYDAIFGKVLERSAAGMNHWTSREMDGDRLRILEWFRKAYP
jgi:hypothetical protein